MARSTHFLIFSKTNYNKNKHIKGKKWLPETHLLRKRRVMMTMTAITTKAPTVAPTIMRT